MMSSSSAETLDSEDDRSFVLLELSILSDHQSPWPIPSQYLLQEEKKSEPQKSKGLPKNLSLDIDLTREAKGGNRREHCFLLCYRDNGAVLRKLPLQQTCSWFLNLSISVDRDLSLKFGKYRHDMGWKKAKSKNTFFEIPIDLRFPHDSGREIVRVNVGEWKIPKSMSFNSAPVPREATFTFVKTKKSVKDTTFLQAQQLIPKRKFDQKKYDSRAEARQEMLERFLEQNQSNSLNGGDILKFKEFWNKTVLPNRRFIFGSFIHRLLAIEPNFAYLMCYSVLTLEEILFGYFSLCVRTCGEEHEFISPSLSFETKRFSTKEEYTEYFSQISFTADYWDSSQFVFLESVLRCPNLSPDVVELLKSPNSFILHFYQRFFISPACVQLKKYNEIMSIKNIKNTQAAWSQVSGKLQSLGVEFYQSLFEKYPQAVDYFQDTNMDTLSLHIFRAIGTMINMLDNFPKATPLLIRIADRHLKSLIPSALYPPVASHLILILEKNMGSLSEPVEELISTLMKKISAIFAEPMIHLHDQIELAESFVLLTKKELGWLSSRYLDRRFSIVQEITGRGAYHHSPEEFQAGMKMAWRNSTHPVDQPSWKSLVVCDCRHISNPDNIFGELMNHLRMASGFEALATVFRSELSGEVWGPRIWNSEVIQYACYESGKSNTLIGNPANLAFTKRCIAQGWQPPDQKTPFDILPVVIESPGVPVQIYQIPQGEIQEVILSHPTNPKFVELGYRWPGVSPTCNLSVNLGGIDFSCCVISGRTLASQVSHKILESCPDAARKVAQTFNLDMTSNDTLWKDLVLYHLNLAVLHSFKQAKFMAVDDHTASEQFAAFQKLELMSGRQTFGQWSKIGCSMCFHETEMLRQAHMPQFSLQVNIWDVKGEDGWRNPIPFEEKVENSSQKQICLVLYGSQTGTSQEYAQKVSYKLRRKEYDHQLMSLDDGLRILQRSIEKPDCPTITLLILTSTFSGGKPPENAKNFYQYLKSRPISENWKKIFFSILAFGSGSFKTYCQCGLDINSMLEALDAHRLAKLIKVDDLQNPARKKEEWFHLICGSLFPPSEQGGEDDFDEVLSVKPSHFSGEKLLSWQNRCLEVYSQHRGGILTQCTSNEELLGDATETRSTCAIHLAALHKGELSYCAGDHVAVVPVNCDETVQGIAELYGIRTGDMLDFVNLKIPKKYEDEDEDTTSPLLSASSSYYVVVNRNFGESNVIEEEPTITFPYPAPFAQIFGVELDLTIKEKHSGPLFSLMLKYETDPRRRRKLEKIIDQWDDSKSLHKLSYGTVLDVFRSFRTSRPPLGELIDALPRLQPRFYSISSAPSQSPNSVLLTVNLCVAHDTSQRGVCSSFLCSLEPGHSLVRLQVHPSSFRLPSSISHPMLLVGPGPGIAPLMGFIGEMESTLKADPTIQEKRWCRLYHSCHNDKDVLYRSKLIEWEQTGVLTTLRITKSRTVEQKKVLQSALMEDAPEIWEKMGSPNFCYYLCGDGETANSILTILMLICASEGGLNYAEIVEKFENLKREGRYQTDVWGLMFSFEEAAVAMIDAQKKQKNKNQSWLKNVKNINEEATRKRSKSSPSQLGKKTKNRSPSLKSKGSTKQSPILKKSIPSKLGNEMDSPGTPPLLVLDSFQKATVTVKFVKMLLDMHGNKNFAEIEHFLLGFSNFGVEPLELFETLQVTSRSPHGTYPESFCFILRTWMSHYASYYDLNEKRFLRTVANFVTEAKGNGMNPIKLLILRGTAQLVNQCSVMKKVSQLKPEKVVPPKEAFVPSFFGNVSAVDLARVITFVTFRVFVGIAPSEVYDGAWQGEERIKIAPHLFGMTLLFNQIAFLCSVEILYSPTDEAREAAFIKCVDIATALEKMNNFEGMAAVTSVFSSASILRLKDLWSSIHQKAPKIHRKLKKLEDIMSTYKNFHAYNHLQASRNPPILPWMGPKLRELRFLADGNPKFKGDGTINFEYLLTLGKTIREFLRFKFFDFGIEQKDLPVSVINLLEDVLFLDSNAVEDIFYEQSTSLRPT